MCARRVKWAYERDSLAEEYRSYLGYAMATIIIVRIIFATQNQLLMWLKMLLLATQTKFTANKIKFQRTSGFFCNQTLLTGISQNGTNIIKKI